MKIKLKIILFTILAGIGLRASAQNEVWKDPKKDIELRIKDLMSKLSLEEKCNQMMNNSPAIERLGIPSYNWWNESLHGVARNGKATVFPQPIGLAATFDADLIFRIGSAISDEARAKFNQAVKIGNRKQYAGITFWTPNVNIFRDPRWGRGQETYGEDPYLTSEMGVQLVKGMQGNDPKYLKVASCAKHYVVHSGPEVDRHVFDAVPSKKDFKETYLPAFERLVKEAHVEAVMCAYNRTYGEPCCGSPYLLTDILRKEWGFQGHIVTDCDAIWDINVNHKTTKDVFESAALAVKSGVSLNCGSAYQNLFEAHKKGLVTEEEINQQFYYLLKTRFKLGLLDPENSNPYNKIPISVVDCPKHRTLAREAAAKSFVLIKNSKNVLPLKKDIKSIYVVGPNATSVEVLLGNYYGVNGNLVTFLEGIVGAVGAGTTVEYKPAFLLDRASICPVDWTADEAHSYEAIVVCCGISPMMEGEEGESLLSPTFGDRKDLGLPQNQIDYLKKLKSKGTKPIILVLNGGSPITSPEVYDLADAILWAWYPGEEGGNAMADVIFGDVSPSGKMPITFPASVDQLPPYESYSMEGRTYKYMTSEPWIPFGFGLSYTNFEYSNLQLSNKSMKKGETIDLAVTIKNIGKYTSDEVVQFYLKDVKASVRIPIQSLIGFERITLKAGESKTINFKITEDLLKTYNEEGNPIIEAGEFRIIASSCVPGKRGLDLGAAKYLEAGFTLE